MALIDTIYIVGLLRDVADPFSPNLDLVTIWTLPIPTLHLSGCNRVHTTAVDIPTNIDIKAMLQLARYRNDQRHEDTDLSPPFSRFPH